MIDDDVSALDDDDFEGRTMKRMRKRNN